MLDTAFFMTLGGFGVSLAGFGGLFSALHQDLSETEPAVYRWRIRDGSSGCGRGPALTVWW